MTIQELFDRLRLEPDWTKQVVILNDGIIQIKDVVPNIINDSQIFLTLEEQ